MNSNKLNNKLKEKPRYVQLLKKKIKVNKKKLTGFKSKNNKFFKILNK